MSINNYFASNSNSLSLDAYVKNFSSVGEFNYKAGEKAANRVLAMENDGGTVRANWKDPVANPAVYGNQIDVKFVREIIPAVNGYRMIYADALTPYNPAIYSLAVNAGVTELTLKTQGPYLFVANIVTKESNSQLFFKLKISGQSDGAQFYNRFAQLINGVTNYSDTIYSNKFVTTAPNRTVHIEIDNSDAAVDLDAAQSYITFFLLKTP